jgi:uncharacterized RDD family membrane protein YckC
LREPSRGRPNLPIGVINMVEHPTQSPEVVYTEPPTVHVDLTAGPPAAPAPHLRRLLAFLFDVVGVAVVMGVAGILGAVVELFNPVWFALVFAIVLVYYQGVSVWLTGGQTAGKALCGLTVRRVVEQGPATFSGLAWSLGRHSVGYVVIDVLGLGALVAFVNRRRRCMHDYVFGSEVVVRAAVGATSPATPAARMEDFQTRFKAALEELDKRYAWLFFLGRWLSKVVAFVAALLFFAAKPLLKWLGDSVTADASSAGLPPAKPLATKGVVGLSATTTAATTAVAVLIVNALQPAGIENINVTITRQKVGQPRTAEIWTMKANGQDQKTLTSNDASDIDPDLFADRRIVFASDRDGEYEIYVMNADGTEQKRLTTAAGDDLDPKWSSDGKKIVFTSYRDGDGEIYVMNADGKKQERLTTQPGDDRSPAWSPDNRKIVFTSDRDGNGEIYIMNADGKKQERLTNANGDDRGARWSPDGDLIAFTSDRDGNDEIYVMNTDGTRQKRLTNDDASDRIPFWSPDGEKILFDSGRGLTGGGTEIWAMNPDGTDQFKVTGFNVTS